MTQNEQQARTSMAVIGSDAGSKRSGGRTSKTERGAGGGGSGGDGISSPGSGGPGRRAKTSASATRPPAGTPDLRKDLRDFASARPDGWGHQDWLHFLENLKDRGHNITDREAIGIALEKERLDLVLEGIRGIGPQRRQALVSRYGNVWSVRNASIDEIASVGGLTRSLAEQVQARVG